MVRLIFIFMLLFQFSYAKNPEISNIYTKNCVSCHKKIPVSIDKYFYRYLLKYSSKVAVNKAMFEYLKKPYEKNSIMPKAFIKRFGSKKETKLNDQELKKALGIYWEKYKVFGKLK